MILFFLLLVAVSSFVLLLNEVMCCAIWMEVLDVKGTSEMLIHMAFSSLGYLILSHLRDGHPLL